GARSTSTLGLKLERLAPGSLYSIRITRGARTFDYQFQANLKPDRNHLTSTIILLFVSLVWFSIGMVIGLLKPQEKLCQLASIASIASAWVLLQTDVGLIAGVYPYFETWEPRLFYIVSFIHPLHLAIAFHFWCYFLFGSSRPRLWSLIQHLLYITGGLLFLAFRWRETISLGPTDSVIHFYLQHVGFLKFL